MANDRETYSFLLYTDDKHPDDVALHEALQFTRRRLEEEYKDLHIKVTWRMVLLEMFKDVTPEKDQGPFSSSSRGEVTVSILEQFGDWMLNEFIAELEKLGVSKADFQRSRQSGRGQDPTGGDELDDDMLRDMIEDFNKSER